MNDLIEYICQIFGLEIKSKIAMLDMENDIGEIQNHADYAKYLKNGFNLDDIKFLTAYQKFLTLTKRYKEIEIETINRSRIESMGSLAEKLAQKVKQFDVAILNHPHKNVLRWEHIKSIEDTSVNYFGNKEIKALYTIGKPLYCIELQRAASGMDMLCERLEALFVERVTHPQLETPKESNQLIANLARSKQSN